MERISGNGETIRSFRIFYDEGYDPIFVRVLNLQIDLKKGLIVELNILLQETLFLKQIGVIPYGQA